MARAVRTFAGAMAGEIAHELNNRLATLRETVGLLDDLARAGKAGAGGEKRARASLDDQVGRALNAVRGLVGLGAALGTPTASFDPGATVGELLTLTGRWARGQALRVEREIAPDLPRAAGDAAVFLSLVHRLLLRCVAGGGPGCGVRVCVSGAGPATVVRLTPAGPRGAAIAAPPAGEEETDRALAARLGAEVRYERGGAASLRLAAAR